MSYMNHVVFRSIELVDSTPTAKPTREVDELPAAREQENQQEPATAQYDRLVDAVLY